MAARAGQNNTQIARFAGLMKQTMKKIDYLQSALIRFGQYKIGLSELVDLLSVAKGLETKTAISAASGRDERVTLSRLRHLRQKGLINSRFAPDGSKIFKLTKLGEKILCECMK